MTGKGSKKDSNKGNKEILRALSLFTQIGVTMVVTVAVGMFAGIWLDSVFSTTPLLMLVFILLGVLAALRNLFKLVKVFYDDEIREDDKENDE